MLYNLGISNQPKGEDVISLHYTFLSSQMCGDLSVSKACPPISWKFVFMGTFSDFFVTQFHKGVPKSSEMKDVIYLGNRFYVKSFPKYYDIPIKKSLNGLYSQCAYLINTPYSTWDGNVYGSVVSFSIYEHDDVVSTTSGTSTITMSNTTKVSSTLSLKEIFTSGSDFDENVTRTSTYTYNIDASKDVELGQNASVYYDQNYRKDGKIYGINKSTGSVVTHFAFYY